jgi:hypothetical protein
VARDDVGRWLKRLVLAAAVSWGKERALAMLCYPCRASVTSVPERFPRFVARCLPLEGRKQLNKVY